MGWSGAYAKGTVAPVIVLQEKKEGSAPTELVGVISVAPEVTPLSLVEVG